MAVEAQKMMALSIGKLAASRSKRSGVSLHRNLLVSTVLFRARNAIIQEKMGFFERDRYEDVPSDEEDPQEVPEMDSDDESDEEIPSQVGLGNPLPCASEPVSEVVDNGVENKENSPPVNNVLKSDSDVKDKSDKSESDKCNKCLKRRSEGENDECRAPKRAKPDCDSDNVFVEASTETQNEPEPMQTEQISSLVNRFSSSFTGLLTCNSQNIKNVEQKSDNKSQDSSLISCSTQIQQAFDTLARPIIALAV